MKVTKEILSPYCKNIQEQFGISIGQVAKLIPTLSSKKNYELHYRNLQLYLSLGLKLKKVYRVLEFDQSPWLPQYINFSTQKRMNAKNASEKDFFKLLNNSVFGKTMENIRKRVDARLVTDQKKLSKLVSKPTFVNSKIFNEDLVAVHKIKETLTLDRPAYVGMCILDLSKTLMYDFHYNYIKSRYNNKAKLLFTDTDQTVFVMRLRQGMFIRNFGRTNNYLTIVITPKIVHTSVWRIKKLSASLKMKQLACLLGNLLDSTVKCILM